MSKKLEHRQLTEVRFEAKGDEVTIRGIAVPYETEIDYGGWFRESFAKNAFKDGIDERVVLLANHQGLPYARTGSDTLEFKEKKDGLYFSALLDTRDPDAKALSIKIEREDLNGVSVGFIANEQRWIYSDDLSEEPDRRIIERAELQEISVTPIPAYKDTHVEMDEREFKVALECRDKWRETQEVGDDYNRERHSVMSIDYEIISVRF